MLRHRVIPILLLKGQGLVKTLKFRDPIYIGDPINTVRIFNEKEVDELILLDINATIEKREPDYKKIEEIVSEAFMPIGYGGGINKVEQIERLFKLGIEKIILNNTAIINPQLISKATEVFGNQSVVVSIDVKKNLWGKWAIYSYLKKKVLNIDLIKFLEMVENYGAGEVFINSVDLDGTMRGYDIELIKVASENLRIPVIICGGAGQISHLIEAIKAGASAVAAGSMFVFQGIHKAVLISYPNYSDLENNINSIKK